MRSDRQLQHRRALALAQSREQHYPSVGKFQRIVMGHGIIYVDLSEACKPLSYFLVWKDADPNIPALKLAKREYGSLL